MSDLAQLQQPVGYTCPGPAVQGIVAGPAKKGVAATDAIEGQMLATVHNEVLGRQTSAVNALEALGGTIVSQMQVTLNTRQHVMLNVGVRLPLTHASERSTQLLVYVLWDWFDGGLFSGW